MPAVPRRYCCILCHSPKPFALPGRRSKGRTALCARRHLVEQHGYASDVYGPLDYFILWPSASKIAHDAERRQNAEGL